MLTGKRSIIYFMAFILVVCVTVSFSVACATEEITTEETEEATVEEATVEETTTEEATVEETTTEEATTEGEGITMGLILKNLTNSWFTQTLEGAEGAAEELNVELIVLNCMEQPETHQNQVMDLISSKVDAIITFATSIEGGEVMGASANEAGIPFILLDNFHKNMDLDVMTSDNIKGGNMQAEYVIEKLNGEGVVVILQGTAGELSAQNRTQGNIDIYENYPDIRVVGPYAADWDANTAMQVMEDVIQKELKIDAVVANNDTMILGAIAALEAAGIQDVITVGWDTIPEGIDAIRAGQLDASVDANAIWLGDTAVRAAYAMVTGVDGESVLSSVELFRQSWGFEPAIVNPIVMLTEENVDELYPVEE